MCLPTAWCCAHYYAQIKWRETYFKLHAELDLPYDSNWLPLFRCLASAGKDGNILIWDTIQGTVLRSLGGEFCNLLGILVETWMFQDVLISRSYGMRNEHTMGRRGVDLLRISGNSPRFLMFGAWIVGSVMMSEQLVIHLKVSLDCVSAQALQHRTVCFSYIIRRVGSKTCCRLKSSSLRISYERTSLGVSLVWLPVLV